MNKQGIKFQTYVLQSLILFSLLSCSSHSSRSEYYKSFDQIIKTPSYTEKKYSPLKPIKKFGQGRSYQLGKPYGVANVDLYTIVTDQANKTIHIFKDTTHIKSIARYGKGPGEFQHIGALRSKSSGNSFWLYDATLFRFQKFNLNKIIDSSVDKKPVQKIVNIQSSKTGYLNRPIWLNDTTIVSSGLFTAGRVAFFNSQGKWKKNVGPKLPSKKNKNVPYKVRSHAYMGFTAAKPDGSMFAIADQYTDKIEIYNSQGHPQKLIIGALNFEPYYTVAHPSGGSTMATSGKTRWAYVSICATNRRIYTLYSGKLETNKNYLGNSIHVFNWNGLLLGVYPLKSNSIIDISIDTSHEKLYALDYLAKKPITIYKLPSAK